MFKQIQKVFFLKIPLISLESVMLNDDFKIWVALFFDDVLCDQMAKLFVQYLAICSI